MFEYEYAKLIKYLLTKSLRATRNGNTKSMFGVQLNIWDTLMNYFPVIQGRKMFVEGVVGELAAFLKGPKSLKDFEKQGCNFWKKWADSEGNLDLDYGNAWLDYNGVNQLQNVVDSLILDPYGRRHIINAWRPDRIDKLSLPCCHYNYQWYVNDEGTLDMIWIQRSADVMIGLPSDIISAALFNLLMAQTVDREPGTVIMQLGDVHIYEAHETGAKLYLEQIKNTSYKKPKYELSADATVFNFEPSMFSITDYEYQPAIKMEVIA